MIPKDSFYIDDSRSIRRLGENPPGTAFDPESYERFILNQLLYHNGIMPERELDESIRDNFGPNFSNADTEETTEGKKRYRQYAASAKAVLARAERAIPFEKNGVRYRVLIGEHTDPASKRMALAQWRNRKQPKPKLRYPRRPQPRQRRVLPM